MLFSLLGNKTGHIPSHKHNNIVGSLFSKLFTYVGYSLILNDK